MGMFNVEVVLGSFEGVTVTEVDLTGLTGCSVNIKAGDGPCVAVASGRRGPVREIKTSFTSTGAIRRMTISNGASLNVCNTGRADADPESSANTGYRGPLSRAANIIISKTGDADATGGGCANSGIDITDDGNPTGSQEEIHIVRPDEPFVRIIFGTAVTVTITVPSGTEVKYHR